MMPITMVVRLEPDLVSTSSSNGVVPQANPPVRGECSAST